MTLEKAYKIGLKYGFAFNGVGPSLSVVDGKVGICINLLDNDFGYLKRNYSFDDADDFDEFLKKYNYYLHNRKEKNLYLTLENYEDPDPEIIYSYETENIKKKQIEEENKEILLKDMQSFLNHFIDSLDPLRKAIGEKILLEQDYYNKLQYYKDLLCKAYEIENEEETMSASKEELEEFNEKVKEFDLSHKRDLSSLELGILTLDDLNEKYTELYNDCKSFLEDEDIINTLFDRLRFKDNIDVLDIMISYLINHPKAEDDTEEKLNELKEEAASDLDIEDYKEQYKEDYLSKYEDVSDSYNEIIFGADKVEFKELSSSNNVDEKKIADLKAAFDNLAEEQQTAIKLIHSPIKQILLYVIEQAYFKNKKFNFDREDFRRLYESLSNSLKKSNNLAFKIKYFKNISFNIYEDFIKSVVKTAKTICAAYGELPFDLKLYSLNYDACMICASDSPIKSGSDVINIINAAKGCPYLYSPIKITYSKEDDSLKTSDNNNVLYFPRYLNNLSKQKDIITLNIFEEAYSIDKVKNKNLLIIDKFNLDKSIKYKFSDMEPKR